MAFFVTSSSAGTPFKYDIYSYGSTSSAKTENGFANVYVVGDEILRKDGTTTSSSCITGYDISLLEITTVSNTYTVNGGGVGSTISTVSQSFSRSSHVEYGDTVGSAFATSFGFASTFYSAVYLNSSTSYIASDSSSETASTSFTLGQPFFQKTKLDSNTLRFLTTRTVSQTQDYYGLWYLTSNPSNTLGTELAWTSTAKRGVFDSTSTTILDTILTTETCGRSSQEVYQVYEPLFTGGFYVDLDRQVFLFTGTSTPSYNSNGLYLASVVVPTSAGYGKSASYTLASELVNAVGGLVSTKAVPNFDIAPPATNSALFPDSYYTSEVTRSVHRIAEATDMLYGNQYLTTMQSGTSDIYRNEYFTYEILDVSDQVIDALYNWAATSVSTNDSTVFEGSYTGKVFLNLISTKSHLAIDSFFDSTTRGSLYYNAIVETTKTYYGVVNYDFSTSTSTSSAQLNSLGQTIAQSYTRIYGGTTYNAQESKRSATYYATTDYGAVGFSGGAGVNSGQGKGLKKLFTGLQLIDFLLQDPYSKGTSYPMAKELDGGFNTMGYLGGGYPNPANFFNFTDDLVGDMGGGYNLANIEPCHRINLSSFNGENDFGLTNAFCPPTRNTSISWLSQAGNSTGTTQFLTYSFGTSPTYTITTANKRSNSTASITSGTATKRWVTAGSLETGYSEISGIWSQTAQYSTFGINFEVPDYACYIATDFSSNGSSSTKTIRGLLGADSSPADTLDYSVTRYLGKYQNLTLVPIVRTDTQGFQPIALVYVRPAPTSYLGFIGKIPFARRAGASLGAVGTIGYPFYNVTAKFSDPSF